MSAIGLKLTQKQYPKKYIFRCITVLLPDGNKWYGSTISWDPSAPEGQRLKGHYEWVNLHGHLEVEDRVLPDETIILFDDDAQKFSFEICYKDDLKSVSVESLCVHTIDPVHHATIYDANFRKIAEDVTVSGYIEGQGENEKRVIGYTKAHTITNENATETSANVLVFVPIDEKVNASFFMLWP